MSHKVHPKIYRIPYGTEWSSRWFNLKKFKYILEEDFYIRELLKEKLKKAYVANIEIERVAGQLRIIISTARPGLLIGRQGAGAEELRGEIVAVLARVQKRRRLPKGDPSKLKAAIKIEIKEIKNPETSAPVVARNIAEQLERRIPFRRVIKHTLEKIMSHKEVKGAKIEVSGRLDGAEIGRREWISKGRLPRITLRSDIDYVHDEALCTYGKLGIKVWIYKGEKFGHINK